jgi:hypothetical protein
MYIHSTGDLCFHYYNHLTHIMQLKGPQYPGLFESFDDGQGLVEGPILSVSAL